MTEEERLREIARRPSPLKSLLDIGSTIGTYGVEKMREMPSRAARDIESYAVEPAKSAYHAGAQITGQEPYDREEAIKHALNIANAMTLGAGAYEAPEGALRAGLLRNREHPLMAVHETNLDKLRLSQRQGGLPARSTGIINPENAFGVFGDISLVGDKRFATPAGSHHRVFHGDPYTPNPLLTERPVEDVVADVRQQPYRLHSESVVSPELVRARLTPEFKTFEDMESKSNLLTSRRKSQEYKDLSDQFMSDIRERMMPHYRGSDLLPDAAAHRAMVDPEFRNRYFKNLPADVEEDIAALPGISEQAPQHYFEAKNYGIANVGHPSLEYAGAIVPHHLGPQAKDILHDFGIRDIYHTDTDDPEKLMRAYEQFKHLQFADGGQVWDKPRPKGLGKPSHLTSKQKASAKAAAEAAGRPYPNLIDNMRAKMAKADGGRTPAWQRSEGKDPEGGLNAKGRAAYNRQNPGKPGLKPPAPHPKTEKDASRRASFCARMKGMKSKLTSSETANDPNSRINKSLRAWNCRADGGSIMHPDIIDALRLAERRHYDNGGAADPVSQYYQQYLGRAPDAGGLAYWQNQLNSGAMTPQEIAQRFQDTDESRQYMAARNARYSQQASGLQRLQGLLGRAAGQPATGKTDYAWGDGNLGPDDGPLPSASNGRRAAQRLGPYIQAGNPPTRQGASGYQPNWQTSDPISQYYYQYLGRAPDAGGYSYWQNQLNSGAMTPQEIAQRFQGSTEAQQRPPVTPMPFVGKNGGGGVGQMPPMSSGTPMPPMPFVGKNGGGGVGQIPQTNSTNVPAPSLSNLNIPLNMQY